MKVSKYLVAATLLLAACGDPAELAELVESTTDSTSDSSEESTSFDGSTPILSLKDIAAPDKFHTVAESCCRSRPVS
jgi:hypothetical protein